MLLPENGYSSSAGSFGALAGAFVIDALGEMIPWLIVMSALVVADLVAGITRCLKQNEKVRFSKAVRETMSKFCIYFSVVVAFAFYDVASGHTHMFSEGACFMVMAIEASSIASNVLKWHGYDVNFNKLIALMARRRFNLDEDDMDGVIVKETRKRNKKTGRFVK